MESGKQMIKAGIIGFGRMGVSHCAIANAHPDVEVAAICEPSGFVTKAVEKYAGLSCYKDFKKVIDSVSLDCVFITTPTKLHYEMVQYAVDAGLHVFVEKPFCLTPEDSAALVKLAEEKQVVNQVGYHNRFVGTFCEAKRIVEMGGIGEVYHVLGEAYGPVVLKKKGSTWRSKSSEGGGCLYDYAAHVINLVEFMTGTPDMVSGAVLKSIYSQSVDDAVYATLVYNKGITGQLSVNWSDETYRKMSTSVTLLGSKGKIIVDAQELKVYFKDEPMEDSFEKGWNMRWVTDLSPDVDFYLRGEEYSAQIDHFIACIKEKNFDNINSFAKAHATDKVIAMIQKNAQRKEMV
jgi:predicted dehydrogenase